MTYLTSSWNLVIDRKGQKELGKKRIYNSAFKERGCADVVKWDVFPIRDGERIKVAFESASSAWRQGVWLKTDKGILVNGLRCQSAELWKDKAPAEVICECLTSDGFLSIYNIWDRGNGRESQAWSSGMLIESCQRGRRYRCNDIGFDTHFDKMVFRIERVSK